MRTSLNKKLKILLSRKNNHYSDRNLCPAWMANEIWCFYFQTLTIHVAKNIKNYSEKNLLISLSKVFLLFMVVFCMNKTIEAMNSLASKPSVVIVREMFILI